MSQIMTQSGHNLAHLSSQNHQNEQKLAICGIISQIVQFSHFGDYYESWHDIG